MSHLEIENNKSSTLLVFQAPGKNEWKAKRPLISTDPYSASKKINNSLKRINKCRTDYDITNTVQCYPGYNKTKKRDYRPCAKAVKYCMQQLELDILLNKYTKVIAFGNIARKAVEEIKIKNNLGFKQVNCKHPSGGLSRFDLDTALQ
jgi:uracil-DNA glycosylase family 4